MICKYDCKGCSLLNVDYGKQLKWKRELIAKSIDFDNVKVFSGKEYGYRNRLELVYNKGLAQRGKKGLVNIDGCVIANEKINNLIKEVNGFNFECVNGVVIRATRKESALIFLLKEGADIEQIKKFSTSAENVLVNYGEIESNEGFAVKGKETLTENMCGKEFIFNAFGFFQNNIEVAEKMIDYVHEILLGYKNAQLLDLYGGVGVFGVVNAHLFKEVVIVEEFEKSVEMANINILNNKVTNAKAICLEAKSIGRLEFNERLFVITDPPRSGMEPRTIDTLKKLKPEVIIYVSCNPIQLGKDIKKFKEYTVKSAALFDMFPQTKHCEAVVEMVRNAQVLPHTRY